MSAIPALKSIPCQPLELVQVARRLGEQFSTRAAQFDDSDEFVGENYTAHREAGLIDAVAYQDEAVAELSREGWQILFFTFDDAVRDVDGAFGRVLNGEEFRRKPGKVVNGLRLLVL